MKRLLTISGLTAMVIVVTGGAVLAAHRLTASVPPIQGKQLSLVINADTVTGNPRDPNATSGPNATCAQTNFFRVGDTVVFRVWGTDVLGGGYSLTPANVAQAQVRIPDSPSPIVLPLAYVGEPYQAPTISYWEAHWQVPKGYPLGTINFHVVVRTKGKQAIPAVTGKWSQKGFASNSDLQITT